MVKRALKIPAVGLIAAREALNIIGDSAPPKGDPSITTDGITVVMGGSPLGWAEYLQDVSTTQLSKREHHTAAPCQSQHPAPLFQGTWNDAD